MVVVVDVLLVETPRGFFCDTRRNHLFEGALRRKSGNARKVQSGKGSLRHKASIIQEVLIWLVGLRADRLAVQHWESPFL